MKLLPFLSFVLFLLSILGGCVAFHSKASLFLTSIPSSSKGVEVEAVTSPAVIEKGATVIKKRKKRSAILESPATERRRRNSADQSVRDRRNDGDMTWEVRIYNDGMNTREHVARSLVQITGMTEIIAYQTMMQAHQNGMACVGRFCFEVAEMYKEGLRKQGIVSDIVPVDEEE